jgi:bla regulator protein blaR1
MPMLKLRRAMLFGVSGIIGACTWIVLSLSGVLMQAQTAADTVPEWQKAAGGNLSFEVASIRRADPDKFTPPNFALDFLDSFGGANPHGRFVAQFPVENYIGFAYKLFPYSGEQKEAKLAHAPKWVSTDPYAINALAVGNPTKDQMRLMMQSLLVDRFKLAIHFERREATVFALVLDKPGKTAAKLYPHSSGPPCDMPSDVFPQFCDQLLATGMPNYSAMIGSRNVTMAQIAAALYLSGRLARPVVDQTGLDGRFDFTLEWIRESDTPGLVDLQEGTNFHEALQEQLGLKLRSTKISLDTLIIDHVERPSEN